MTTSILMKKRVKCSEQNKPVMYSWLHMRYLVMCFTRVCVCVSQSRGRERYEQQVESIKIEKEYINHSQPFQYCSLLTESEGTDLNPVCCHGLCVRGVSGESKDLWSTFFFFF